MQQLLNILTVASSILLALFVLLQARGASLGAGFGGSSELFTARRGIDKIMYQITIILAVVFVLSIVLNIMTA